MAGAAGVVDVDVPVRDEAALADHHEREALDEELDELLLAELLGADHEPVDAAARAGSSGTPSRRPPPSGPSRAAR